MKRIIILFVLLALITPVKAPANFLVDTDRQVNSWVSSQDPWVDDAIHFTTGAAIYSLSHWGLGKMSYFKKHVWQKRLLASSIPLSLRIIEESTNKHPDWKNDITWNVIGISVAMAFTFEEVHAFFRDIKARLK